MKHINRFLAASIVLAASLLAQQSPVTVINNVADLLAYQPQGVTTNRLVMLSGYYAANDGGEGEFRYIAANYTTNYGTVFPAYGYAAGVGPVWLRQTRLADPLNVKWFGAVGNGTADDTDEFESAISAASTDGVAVRTSGNDKSVFVPFGSYVISDTIVLTNGLTLIGESSTRSQILFTGANKPCIEINNVSSFLPQYRIENLTFYHWSANGTPGTEEIAIIFEDCSNAYKPVIKNVNIRHRTTGYQWYHGVVFDTSTAGPQSGTLENVLVTNARGNSFANYANMNAVTIISCYSSNPAGDGFHWDGGGNYCTFINCANDTPGVYGYYLKDVNTFGLVGCGVENAGTSGIYATNSYGLRIDNCYVEQTASASHLIQLLDCNMAQLTSVRATKTGGADADFAIYASDADGYYWPQVFGLHADVTQFTSGYFNTNLFNLSSYELPADGESLVYDVTLQQCVWGTGGGTLYGAGTNIVFTGSTNINVSHQLVLDKSASAPATGANKAALYAAEDSDTVTRIALKNSDGTTNSFQTMGVSTLSVTTSAAVPNLTSTNYLKLLSATASKVLVTDANQYVTNSAIAIADVKTTRVGVVREVWVPASAMNPFATAGAAFTTNTWATTTDGQAIEAYDFDDATDEAVQFTLSLPLAWDGADPKMKIFWKPVAEEDGYTNIWGAVAGSLANNDDGGNTLGTPATVEDVGLTSTNKLHISPAITVDVGNSPTAGDMIWFKVYRDANATLDELVGDARLLGVMIQYTETTTEPSAW